MTTIVVGEVVNTTTPFVPSCETTITGETKTRRRRSTWTMTIRVSYHASTRRYCWSIGRVDSAGHGLGEDVSSVPCRLRRRFDDPHGRSFKGQRQIVGDVKDGPEMVRAEEHFVRAEMRRIGVVEDVCTQMLGMI